MNKECKVILEYLENAFTGARMSDDNDTAVRIARAIAAFQSDPEKGPDEVFTDDFIRWYFELNFGKIKIKEDTT